ncbi:YlbG family protein [Chryseomicrobium palamuruense]|uniref:YlbG family protein n=1 Tax=Chryseomicrobium palamuruense TaxID=682973 RepID=A0ABV8UUW8_9BACL
MIARQGLIVFVNHLKHAKTLRKYGHVYFISKKLKYAVLYVNQEDVEAVTVKLLKLPFVKKLIPSERPFIKTEYENSKPDKAKEYDYKIGL